MAYNFLVHLKGFAELQKPERRRFSSVIENMTDDGKLSRAMAEKVSKETGFTLAIVGQSARIIKKLTKVLKGDKKFLSTVKKQAAEGVYEAKKTFALYDKKLTWEAIERKKAELENTQPEDVGRGSCLEYTPPLSQAVAAVELELTVLKKENELLRKALQERDSKLWSLHGKLDDLVSSTEGDPRSSDLTVLLDTVEKKEEYIVVTGLPQRAKVGARYGEVEYTAVFLKAFKRLHPVQRSVAVSKINELADRGNMATKKSQCHKKFPRKRSFAPKGCIVSEVTKQIRYMWDYVGDGDKKVLILYFIGKHDEVWNSEG